MYRSVRPVPEYVRYLSMPSTHGHAVAAGVGLAGRVDDESFWWASGQTMRRYAGEDPAAAPGEVTAAPTFADLLPLSGGKTDAHALHSPASFVDDAPPVLNPCSAGGSPAAVPTDPDCKVVVFHHLYIDNNWRAILTDQLVKLVFSGLYDRADVVFSTMSGRDAASMAEAVQLLRSFGSKFRVLEQAVNSTQYERLTLRQIKGHVSPKDLIFYFHLKGAFRF